MPEIEHGRAIVGDEVHLFFLLDNSGSMYGPRIQSLNEAMETLIPVMTNVARSKDVTVYFHVLSFNTYVRWLCGSAAEKGVAMDDFHWHEIDAFGMTNTAAAIRSILPGLVAKKVGHKAFRTIIILVTDGESWSPEETREAVEELIRTQKTTRIAIGVQGYNSKELHAFASYGRVVSLDGFGETVGMPDKQKLVFSVTETQQIAGTIMAASISSLMSTVEDQNRESGTVASSMVEWI